MRKGWLDPNNQQFSKDRIAAIIDLAPDRRDELPDLDRKRAELYQMQPFLAGPDLASRWRENLLQ